MLISSAHRLWRKPKLIPYGAKVKNFMYYRKDLVNCPLNSYKKCFFKLVLFITHNVLYSGVIFLCSI